MKYVDFYVKGKKANRLIYKCMEKDVDEVILYCQQLQTERGKTAKDNIGSFIGELNKMKVSMHKGEVSSWRVKAKDLSSFNETFHDIFVVGFKAAIANKDYRLARVLLQCFTKDEVPESVLITEKIYTEKNRLTSVKQDYEQQQVDLLNEIDELAEDVVNYGDLKDFDNYDKTMENLKDEKANKAQLVSKINIIDDVLRVFSNLHDVVYYNMSLINDPVILNRIKKALKHIDPVKLVSNEENIEQTRESLQEITAIIDDVSAKYADMNSEDRENKLASQHKRVDTKAQVDTSPKRVIDFSNEPEEVRLKREELAKRDAISNANITFNDVDNLTSDDTVDV